MSGRGRSEERRDLAAYLEFLPQVVYGLLRVNAGLAQPDRDGVADRPNDGDGAEELGA